MSYSGSVQRGGGDGQRKYNVRNNGASYDEMGGSAGGADKPNKIVLLNCASDMTPDAIRKWCSQYGNVCNVRFTTTSMGKIFFVDYVNFADAEKALRCINEANPFNIKCEFSRRKESNMTKIERNTSFRSESNSNTSRHSDTREIRNEYNNAYPPLHDNNGVNSRSNQHANRNPNVHHNPVSFEPKINQNTNLTPNGQSNFLSKFNNTATQQSPSLTPPKWNILPTNTTATTDGTKAMVATNKFKEPEPQSTNGIDGPVVSKRGTCLNCKKESKFLCERCKCFYCSHECQAEDWPFHKAVCNELPRLIPVKINFTKNHKILDPPAMPSEIKINPKNSDSTPKVAAKVEEVKPSQNASQPVKPAKRITEVPKTACYDTVADDHPNKEEIDKIEDFYKVQTDLDRTLANTKSDIAFTVNQFSQNIPKQLKIPDEVKEKPAEHLIFGEFPKNRSPVAITAVISPEVVYIRSSIGKESISYCKLLQDVYVYADGAEHLKHIPNKGEMVLADFQGTYNRAIVIKSQSKQEIHIAYLDFGNTDIKRLDELKMINSELQRVPRYTFRVHLKNVMKCSMPEEGLKYLNDLCDGIVELELRYEIADVSGKEKKCELFDPATSTLVNTRVNELMEIKPPTDDDKILMIEDIQVRNMPPGKKVKVVVRDNSLLAVGCVSVATADCELDIKALSAEINRYCNNQKTVRTYTPRINEACLVFLPEEDLWVRAICVETVGNGNPKMQLVDIGSFLDINIKNIRRLPLKLAQVPCCAIQAYLKNLPFPLNQSQLALLEEYFPKNGLIVLDEVEVDDPNPDDGEQSNVITVHKLAELFK